MALRVFAKREPRPPMLISVPEWGERLMFDEEVGVLGDIFRGGAL